MTASRTRIAPTASTETSASVPSQATPRRGRRQRFVDTGTGHADVSVCLHVGSLPDAGGADTVRDVTAPRLLDLPAVADMLGLTGRTVRNYHQGSERRRRLGDPRPGDFPPPDMRFGRTPVWKVSTIRSWKNRRPGRGAGGGRPRRRITE